MRLDYPLELINSKLPKKQPSYYQKWLIGLFIGIIACLFVLLMAEASESTISLVLGAVCALMFVVFFVFGLSKLYNDESDGRDFISVYLPPLTASPIFNSAYGWLKRFNRWFLVVFSYMVLAMVLLIIVSVGYASVKS
ncbi:hypothetical protein [Marinomonas balearica]|uniref:Uncharacterized protein n=1 Tax=Marinomonas balearica TaxID=491947 RepID=A0A4V3CFX9_9GAMM|nr:hypothetical protein [Marinomonas balearica]TDO95582.1 hypothetical protein DFP79_3513 [Marinomonas balearica]